jgi:hypothetical protein
MSEKRGLSRCLAAVLMTVSAFMIFTSCSDSVFLNEVNQNRPPEIELTNGPLEGDTTLYTVHFFWLGHDQDGEIDYYEFCMVEGDPYGFDPVDTTGLEKWGQTKRGDSMFTVSADEYDRNVVINSSLYGKFKKSHTFFVRAVDDRGTRSEAAHRSFTAFTLAPHIMITEPYCADPSSGAQMLSSFVRFRWEGKDPLDSPWNYQEVDSVRYMHVPYTSGIVMELNRNPGVFKEEWSDWYWYFEPGDSGREAWLGDDEVLVPGKGYIFAVQAMDEAGAVSVVFDKRTNVRHFMSIVPTGPVLRINDPYLGTFSFLGTEMRMEEMNIPAGFSTRFSWTGDASSYGGVVRSFRYGWDIQQLDDPSQWSTAPNPYITSAQERQWYSGTHVLFVEVVDNLGYVTLGTLELTVVPIDMSRDLLWVDDFPSLDFTQDIYAFPNETEHDVFWTSMCLNVMGFDPQRDIYDVLDNDFYLPPMEHLWKYKNVIWSYSTASDILSGSVWNRFVKYTPEGSSGDLTLNFLPYYLATGGHLWTVGESQRKSGLAACISSGLFPVSVRCEFYGPSPVCELETGAASMAYRDCCVSVIDKVDGLLRIDLGTSRRVDYDAMQWAKLDDSDPVTGAYEGFPRRLELWENVTRTGMFFDPQVRGMFYVEVYDSDYYMNYIGHSSQPCFHPLYREVARNTHSVVHDQTVAFWYSSYAGVVADKPGCVAAPSVHFGFPLWFYNREQTDSIATAIFKVWQLPVTDDVAIPGEPTGSFPRPSP